MVRAHKRPPSCQRRNLLLLGIAKKCMKAKMEVQETGLDLPANERLGYNLGLGTVETIRDESTEFSLPSISDTDSIGS